MQAITNIVPTAMVLSVTPTAWSVPELSSKQIKNCVYATCIYPKSEGFIHLLYCTYRHILIPANRLGILRDKLRLNYHKTFPSGIYHNIKNNLHHIVLVHTLNCLKEKKIVRVIFVLHR